jgi:hypothetical protein
VCDVANVALFGNVPTVDFVTRTHRKLFESCPTCASPYQPPPHPSSAHDAAPSLSRHALRHVFSLAPLSDAPSSLPTLWDTPPPLPLVCLFFLLFFSLLPLTISLLFSQQVYGTFLSLANVRACCCAVFSPTNARCTPVRFFFLSFSFHSLTAAPSCPSLHHMSLLLHPPIATCHLRPHHVVPSSHVAPAALHICHVLSLSHTPFVTHRSHPVMLPSCVDCPLSPHVVPMPRAFAMCGSCCAVPLSPPQTQGEELMWSSGWAGGRQADR